MKYFFIGIAGAGMSAIAQYLSGKGHNVEGSDRIFLKPEGKDVEKKLSDLGIKCYAQGNKMPDADTDYVVVSTAIEDTVPEFAHAKQHQIPTIHRSDLLAEICDNSYTIAVGGTSGKSTTTAMIYHVLNKCGLSPSLITGAGLIDLQNQGKIGNAAIGNSNILVIEVDESDGTIVKYKPEVGLILNVDKDHKEIPELMELFSQFAKNTKQTLIVNLDNPNSAKFSKNLGIDFSCKTVTNNYGTEFHQTIDGISFKCNGTAYQLPLIGRYNMENALATIAVARLLKIDEQSISAALSTYSGIYRRTRILKSENQITLIDDFAHNPAKICAALSACQDISKRVIAWFQPHGFAPSRLMKKELTEKLSQLLRSNDIMIFSKIYYAGGTANQDISAEEFSNIISANGKNSLYIEDRENLPQYLKNTIQQGDIILLMGARDPSLSNFAEEVKNQIF